MKKARIVRTKRDGFVIKWRDAFGSDRQRKCRGKTSRARETERRHLEEEINAKGRETSWAEFWPLFEAAHLSNRSASHSAKCRTLHRRMTEAALRGGNRCLHCSEITKALVLSVREWHVKKDLEPSTIDSAMATLWSMISWGQDQELIPDFRRPRKRRGKEEKRKEARGGRSLTLEEVERMEAAIPIACKSYERPEEFKAAMRVMLYTGMRLSEVWDFRWEPKVGYHFPVLLDTSAAAIEFSDTQKNGRTELVPVTNEAVNYLRSYRKTRTGASPYVCRTIGKRGEHKTANRLGRVLSEAGKLARIVVKRYAKKEHIKVKYASAHDLRRTFATRLQDDLSIKEKQKLTRHSDAATLLDHYADAPTPVLVAKLRGSTPG